MHRVPVLLLVSLSILITNVQLSAQIIFVDQNATGVNNGSNWSNAYPDLQQALAQAQYGDQIWLAQGHYYPTLCNSCSETDREISFVIPDGVALYGGFTGLENNLEERDWENNPTFLNGDIDEDNSSSDNSYSIVYTEEVSEATIVDGFHIINGNANYTSSLGSPKASGAGWFNKSDSIDHPSSPTIRNCVFEDNKANGFGAGLCNQADFAGKCEPLIENVQFINNRAKEGGAIFNDGSQQGICNPWILNCSFSHNDADQFGGAISNDGAYNGTSNATIENCLFTNNSCDSGGGAIANRGHENGTSNPKIIGSTFIENHSGAIGGAILNFGINGDASPRLYRCQFKFNFASTYGGSLYNHGKSGNSNPKIINCLFYKNEAYSCAGMYNLGSTGGNASPEVTNCTFFGNEAKYGTCIYNNAGSSATGVSSPVITNCIFWKNIATQIPDAHVFRNVSGTPTISHCLVDASSCEILNSGTGANSITCMGGMLYNQAPKFADTLNADFHLLPISPARDNGDNNMMEDYFDLDYNLRLFNNTIDLGVFEYGSMPYVMPSIATDIEDEDACETSDILFEIAVSGTNPLNYQWFKNGNALTGENQNTLMLNDLAELDEGNFYCRVISILGDTIFSATANLQVESSLVVGLDISASETEICAGETINFSTVATHEGANPSYIWEVNGINQHVDSPSFSSSSLSNGDELTCKLISSETCASNPEITSESIIVTVNPLLDVAVDISSTASEICAGELVTFTALGSNGGMNPIYEWSLNGNPIGGNSSSLDLDSLSDGDELSCKLISSATCVTNSAALSESIAVTVNPLLDVAVDISSTANEICAGELVTFTALGSNGGMNPIYEWSLNGNPIGGNSSSLDLDSLLDGDELSCQLISSATCVTNSAALSESIAVTVNPLLDVAVDISSTASEICAGELITFTALGSNGGMNPIYEWSLNGNPIGGNSSSLDLDSLLDGDELSCQLISSATCVTNSAALSESIAVTVNPLLELGVSINSTATEICQEETVIFTASASNAGDSAVYEWFLNGNPIGGNNQELELNNLSDGDSLSCKLTSSENCILNPVAVSNAISVAVNDLLEATVNITASATNICEGQMINVVASSLHEGDNPVYEWRLNGELLAENASVLNLENLVDGDEIQCKLISSKTCVLNQEVLSDPITVTVAPLLETSLAIEASEVNICEGSLVQFTANPENAGNNPTYTWHLNDSILEMTTGMIELDNLIDGDQLSATLISSETCVIDSLSYSDTIQMTVNPQLELDLIINASTTEICAGEEINFEASVENAGNEFDLSWYINEQNIGIEQLSFASANLNDGDIISCIVESNEACLIAPIDTSNFVQVSILENLTPTIMIEFMQDEICKGDTVLFETTFTNEGTNASFQWHLNGVEILGETGATLLTSELNDEDEITCSLTSSEMCLTQNEVQSNPLILDVKDCTVGLNSLNIEGSIELYPNPSRGEFTIEIKDLKESIDLYLVDSKGLIIYKDFGLEPAQAAKIQLQLSRLSAGLYFVKIVSPNQVFGKSLIILD